MEALASALASDTGCGVRMVTLYVNRYIIHHTLYSLYTTALTVLTTHCIYYTLYSYTVLIHCTLTLHSYTALIQQQGR
jgi:hypothetical protein